MEAELEPRVASRPAAAPGVLFVDLDGTLVKGDLLLEGLLEGLKSSPQHVLGLFAAAVRGRAALKEFVASCAALAVGDLPLREEVVELIASVRAEGGLVVLATAAHRSGAEKIASELGLFDDVLATEGATNLKGVAKLRAIEAYCRARGFGDFDYIGDSAADLPIWAAARTAYLAGGGVRLAGKLVGHRRCVLVAGTQPARAVSLVKAMRVRQWAKNLLVFVPAITSHRIFEWPVLLAAAWAFVCFCLCSSGVYVLNDLFDIASDRRHPKKRSRPFAAGAVSIPEGLMLAAALLVVGLGAAAGMMPASFAALLATYVMITTAYSVWAKRVVMLDVVTLACLYAVRVLGGGLATGIAVSEWLMAFSLFIFLSLAFAKRYTELARLSAGGGAAADGRDYQVGDMRLIESMGPPCGFLAVLVLALYIQSEQMKQLYSGSWALWLLCPLLAYWVGRVWFLARRGLLGEDPVVFAIRDRVSWLIAVIGVALLVAASAT